MLSCVYMEPPMDQPLEISSLPLLVSVSDAPKFFGVSRSHVYRIAAQGRIDLVKMGRRTMVKTETMRAYIESLQPMTPSNS